MSRSKCPYSFPARSRAAMITYILANRRGYGDGYGRENFAFNWDVKATQVNYDSPEGEETLDSALDKQWAIHLESEGWQGPVEWAFEDAQREITENEWTSYPGDDQGDWKLEFRGRQGGHLCLTEWRGVKFNYMTPDEIQDWLKELDFKSLKKFYIGMVTADSDFTRAKASKNVEYALNNIRSQWEDEIHAEQEAELVELAESYADARPDLYRGLL